MSDNTTLNAQSGAPGDIIATDDLTTLNGSPVSGVKVQRVKPGYGADGALIDVDSSHGLPVAQQGSWSVSVSNFPATQPVSGPLTDTELRASAVPVSGTFWQATQPVSGPLTDTQLRATAVPVSGTFWQATQPVSLSSLPALATGANTIGSIANTSFGISGTLPAFASTPTVNLGTLNGVALDATLTGGTQKAITRGGAKGATTAADVTSTSVDSNTQALDVSVKGTATVSGTVAVSNSFALETGGNLATVATNTTNVNNTIGTAASAIPTKLVQIGGSDGTNARAIKTNTSGQLDIRPLTSSDQITTVPSGTQTVSGTVAATQSGTWTVQPGNTVNTTPWLVQLSNGTLSPTIQTAATSVAGANNAIVVTFGSAARTEVVGAVAAGSAIGATSPLMMGGSDGTNVRRIKTDTSGNQIAIVSDGTNNAAVKAASTAPAATDPALVVTQSPNGTARTASLAQVTSSGTVSAGAQSVTFANVGTANATVAGGALAPNQTVSFSVNYPDTLAAITYTASATAILNIAKVV
jgi:hypothetical protein